MRTTSSTALSRRPPATASPVTRYRASLSSRARFPFDAEVRIRSPWAQMGPGTHLATTGENRSPQRATAVSRAESRHHAFAFRDMSPSGASGESARDARCGVCGARLEFRTGQYLANARVTVKGSTRAYLTDEAGLFRIPDVPGYK